MSGIEKFDLGRPAEGSTFSTTLHLLSPRLQEWIRGTSDRKKLRRFACACARQLFGLCPQVPPQAVEAIELAERFCEDQLSEGELEAGYAVMVPVVQEAFERFRALERGLETERATLDEYLEAELAHRAALAARACVLRSAPVAAAEAIFEHGIVRARRKMHEALTFFLGRADQVLDRQRAWTVEEQDALLQSYLKDLPRPFVVRLQRASDAALRRFACECAAVAIDFARKDLAGLGASLDLAPLFAIAEAGWRFADGQATIAELRGAYETGLKLARDWYEKEDDLREQQPEDSLEVRAAAIAAETADCVYPCAEASAKLAAVKCLRVAMHVRGSADSQSAIYPLAEQFLGPPPG
jgi:hypothetical protein